jgi:glycine oxidase
MGMHVVVVGGGIVGCMTALELLKRGCEVTLVDRNVVASQTSGESSWAGAGILFPLLPWMYADEVNQLTMTGAAVYPEFCQELLAETGIDPEYRRSGMLLLPRFDMAQALAWCERHGIESQQVATAAYPALSSSEGDTALWLPSVGQVRPPHVLQAMRAYLLKRSVRLLEKTELKPLPMQATLERWETLAGEVLQADRFVVTSGAWSFDLLKEAAATLKIKPMRGQILLYRQPEGGLEHMVYREGFYMVPRRDGVMLAGSTLEDVGFDPGTTEEVRVEMQAKAEAILPALKHQPVLKHWSGLRPGTPENLPTISAHPQMQNLFLNTGHFRYGLTMAPCAARMVAALICGETPAINPRPFSLQP